MCDEKEKCCKPDGKETCCKPEELKGKPEECSPEKVEECHGKVEEHPCESTCDKCCE